MITLEINEEPSNDWNQKLYSSKLGTIYQTPEYANFTRDTMDWKAYFLRFVNPKGEVVSQLMISEYTKINKNHKIKNILRNISQKNKKIIKWLYGPVIFQEGIESEVFRLLHDFLISKNCYVTGNAHPLSSENLYLLGKPFQINIWATFLIDLNQPKEILWNNLDKHSARKNVDRSLTRGVTVKEMNNSDLKKYHEMLEETKQKVKSEVDYYAVETLWNYLKPIGFTGFLAYQNKNPIGGILVSNFNNYVNEWGVARTECDLNLKLYAQDLLKWNIIEWGNKSNFRYYDLSGVNPNSENPKESGIFRYKKKWGGKYVEYQTCTI